jgi:hypothetical protein
MKEAMLRDSSQSSIEPAPTDINRNSVQDEETKTLGSPHEVKSYLNKFIINTKQAVPLDSQSPLPSALFSKFSLIDKYQE